MENTLILNSNNCDSFEATDIVAFSSTGLCGHPGVVRAISRDKRLWEINCYKGTAEEESKVCSILEEIQCSLRNREPIPTGWMRLNAGLGNSVFVTDELRQYISVAGLHATQIYKQWEALILEGLERVERRHSLINGIDKERLSPEWIESLEENEIFVFGSNIFGYHDGGASEHAMCLFGAIYGKPLGIQGQSYAIITDGVSYSEMMTHVIEFLKYAETHPEQRFLVTKLGCGTAGYHESQIAPLFTRALQIPNILLPRDFMKYLL